MDAVNYDGTVILDYRLLNGSFLIEIKDNGSGITEDDKKKIFDLYYSTKKDGNGLGLSITQKIISQHDGTIEIENNYPAGSIFKIKIPQQ